MATPTWTQLQSTTYDLLVANVTSGNPIGDTLFSREINQALRDCWELSGGRLLTVTSALAWTNAHLCTGTVAGILTDVADVEHVYATAVAPFTVSCTTAATTALVAASGSFITSGVVAGMAISGTNISANTFVANVTDATNLVMTKAGAGVSGNPNTITFTHTGLSITATTGVEVEKAPGGLDEIRYLRANSVGMPTYLLPKKYALVRRATDVPAAVNLLQLEYWPAVTGQYFPIEYMPQFREIDSATVTTPDLDDVWANDAAVLAAERLAPRIDRPDLLPEIVKHFSQKYTEAMARKMASQVHAKQGRDSSNAAALSS